MQFRIWHFHRLMARNTIEWKNNDVLKADLDEYVRENVRKCEILDFVKRDYPEYPWSMATLSRRLRHCHIKYINYETPLEAVTNAVAQELNGSGRGLEYKALNPKLRKPTALDLVYSVFTEMDPESLKGGAVNKKFNRKKVPFSSEGPLWVVSLDGYDKLCGYQYWTFPTMYLWLSRYIQQNNSIFVCVPFQF